ncbi:hypothetical protein AB0H76_22985 [Nocardia sp. NPDC050712]|uniref:hypothetical protein n=1 Tax=Nocardia sp. NPDC050712 TaxID=3155518 RepID=UPI0033EA13CB
MATGVGLRIAEDESTAAIVTDTGELRYIVRESILHMAEDGDTVLGGPPPAGNSHSIAGFIASVGDPAGLPVDDGEAYRAEDLVATALFCLINLTAEHLAGSAEFYATHPAHWLTQDVQALREALDYLGLRSVVLVSEADLPAVDTAEPNKSFAYDAARAALAAVLATPAGATPPDPHNAENSTVVTDVIPQVPAPGATAQAYSAALPVATVLPAPTPTEALPNPAPVAPAPPERRERRIPLLIAGAALIGLILGGIGVAVLFRGDDTPEVPQVRDAKSDQATVTPTTAPPPQLIAPPTTEPPITVTTTEEPAPTTTPPPTTTAEPTTTEPPTTTPTTPRRTTTTRPGFGSPPAWEPPENDWTPPTIIIPVPN